MEEVYRKDYYCISTKTKNFIYLRETKVSKKEQFTK